MNVIALRLRPGDDLRAKLEAALPQAAGAGFVLSAVGSLSPGLIRFAGAADATRVEGPLEVLSLSGTIAKNGCHLHIAVADARGTVVGGHVSAGCIVHTTLEIVIGATDEFAFAREHDAATGYPELTITRA
jgi:predicted DNA-binding protein with PD1-like motif